MSVLDFILLLIVAGICGALGQAISGYSQAGCLVSIALGFIGALIGVVLARLLNLPELIAIHFDSTTCRLVDHGGGTLCRCHWALNPATTSRGLRILFLPTEQHISPQLHLEKAKGEHDEE